MSIKLSAIVWEESVTAGSALLTMLAIADWCHDDGTGAHPTVSQLATKTRLSDRSIQRIIVEIEDLGEVIIKRSTGRGRAHDYTIPLTPDGRSIQRVPKGDKLSPVQAESEAEEPGLLSSAENGATVLETERVTSDIEKGDNETGKGDTPRDTNHYQPLEDQPLDYKDTPIHTAASLELQADIDEMHEALGIPDGFIDLAAIEDPNPKFKPFTKTIEEYQAWLDSKGFGQQKADSTAASVRSKWGGQGWKFVDVWAVFRSWMNRPDNTSPAGPTDADPRAKYRQEALRRSNRET